jgi:hypothetical protein
MDIYMQIVDIFHLSISGTTFAGKISEEIPLICKNQYMANLIVDGSIYQENIHIAGEWISRHPDGSRAISTIEVIDLTSDFIKDHDCQLILIERKEKG